MSAFTKIAITVPTATYRAVERARSRLGKSRSAAVALALEDWLRGLEAGEAAKRYIEGYLRLPETPVDLAATEAIAGQATADWPPWTPGEASRATKPRRPARRKRR